MLTVGMESVIYWHPVFNIKCRPMKIYWWINRMQKLHQNIIFFNWNFFINTIILFFFIQATDATAHPKIIHGNFISFLWMESGCKFGSPDKFENGKLYSNAITQQNETAWYCFGFKKNMMIKLAFLTIC